jgi:hypothetical protein
MLSDAIIADVKTPAIDIDNYLLELIRLQSTSR